MKAILVLSRIPESCSHCTLTSSPFDPYIYCTVNGLKIAGKWAELDDQHSRPEWCPLREPPERKYTLDEFDMNHHDKNEVYGEAFFRGYNTCLDEILGEEDAEENGDIIKKKDVEQVVDEVSNMHLYRVPGDYDSYAPYNQGWQDACDSIVAKLNLWED